MAEKAIQFFPTPAKFRRWLELNHAKAPELRVGFYKKDSGRPTITYGEALDEALCHGWIDGVRHRLDAASYSVRFTPRRANSIWSRVNLAHIERLKKAGRLHAAGLKVHAERSPTREGIYSFENAPRQLTETDERLFRTHAPAWNYFQAQAPSYRRTAIWWVISAKQEATRARRLQRLITDSSAGKRIDQFVSSRPKAKTPPASGN